MPVKFKMRPRSVMILWATVVTVALAAQASAALMFTEVMFNPKTEPTWEWVEVHNLGNTTVSLAGWVLDDGEVATRLPSANIASGSIPAGGVAILFNSVVATSTFKAAWNTRPGDPNWGLELNAIPVTNWPSLLNGRDAVQLWNSHATYMSGASALVAFGYNAGGNWPGLVDGSSIHHVGNSTDMAVAANWAISQLNVNGAYRSTVNGVPAEIGSPGIIPHFPEPAALGVLALGCCVTGLSRRQRPVDRPVNRS